MRTYRLRVVMLAMAASITVAGCDGSSSRSPPPPPPPPPPTTVDFTSFVIDQFAATADDTESEPVDDTDFAFNDQDNPDAFSELLPGP
ncbi:MAG: hypothetical protein M3O07_07300 [Pseudomonadota bacterium]|nr:hypothetical protein [Pseudomonadota bacterium]